MSRLAKYSYVQLTRKPLLISVSIFACALFLRLGALALFPHVPIATDTIREYDVIAQNLVDGKGYVGEAGIPTASKAPLFPFVLLVIYTVFGHSFLYAKLFGVVIDSINCVLVYRIARHLFGEKVAKLSSLAVVFYPPLIWFAINVQSEPLFTCLLSFSMFNLLCGLQSSRTRYYVISGVFFGLTSLCRPTTLLFPFLLPLLISSDRASWKGITALLLIFMATLAPWMIRNYLAFDRVIPIETRGTSALWQGSDLEFLKDLERKNRNADKTMHDLGLERNWKNEIEAMDVYREAALRNYARQFHSQPLQLVRLVVEKALRFWFMTDSGRNEGYLMALHGLILLCAIIGIYAAKINTTVLSVLLLVAYFWVAHTVLFPLVRYAVPIMPYVLIFGVFGAWVTLRRHSSSVGVRVF